jgi:hypothetical protein
MGNVITAHVRTAAIVIVVFLILALLSRMSAPEVQLDVTVQHSLNKLVSKSQELTNVANQSSTHPVHRLVYLTQAVNCLDSALLLANPKTCEKVTKTNVQDVYTPLAQQQETLALQIKQALMYQQQQPPQQQQQQQQHPMQHPHLQQR